MITLKQPIFESGKLFYIEDGVVNTDVVGRLSAVTNETDYGSWFWCYDDNFYDGVFINAIDEPTNYNVRLNFGIQHTADNASHYIEQVGDELRLVNPLGSYPKSPSGWFRFENSIDVSSYERLCCEFSTWQTSGVGCASFIGLQYPYGIPYTWDYGSAGVPVAGEESYTNVRRGNQTVVNNPYYWQSIGNVDELQLKIMMTSRNTSFDCQDTIISIKNLWLE